MQVKISNWMVCGLVALSIAACGEKESCPEKKNLDLFKKSAQEFQKINEKINSQIRKDGKVVGVAALDELYTLCLSNLKSAQAIKSANESQLELKNNFVTALNATCESVANEIAIANESDPLKKINMMGKNLGKAGEAFAFNPFSFEVNCGKANESVMAGVKGNSDSEKLSVDNSNESLVKKVELQKFSWSAGDYGNYFALNGLIVNKNEFPVKDIQIYCETYANSGTKLNQIDKVLYEIVDPTKPFKIKNFMLGSINPQSSKAGCVIVGAEKAVK